MDNSLFVSVLNRGQIYHFFNHFSRLFKSGSVMIAAGRLCRRKNSLEMSPLKERGERSDRGKGSSHPDGQPRT
jgi:hypothetical protein